MKRFTILAVAALTACAMTAAVTAASASAAVLCSEAESKCASENILPAGSYFSTGKTPSVGSFSLKNTVVDLQCSYVMLATKTTAESGLPLPGETFGYLTECKSGANPECSQASATTVTSSILATGGGVGNGSIGIGTSSQPFAISFTCPKGSKTLKCTFSNPVVQEIRPSEEFGEEAKITGASMTRTSPLDPEYAYCGEAATLNYKGGIATEDTHIAFS